MGSKKQDYHPKWPLISKLIKLRRAGNCCESCGVRNKEIVRRRKDGTWTTPGPEEWEMIHSRVRHSGYSMLQSIRIQGYSKIVLKVVHLDQDTTNNRFGNLRALCQHEHFLPNPKARSDNKKYGRNWKGDHQLKLDL